VIVKRPVCGTAIHTTAAANRQSSKRRSTADPQQRHVDAVEVEHPHGGREQRAAGGRESRRASSIQEGRIGRQQDALVNA